MPVIRLDVILDGSQIKNNFAEISKDISAAMNKAFHFLDQGPGGGGGGAGGAGIGQIRPSRLLLNRLLLGSFRSLNAEQQHCNNDEIDAAGFWYRLCCGAGLPEVC